MIDIAVQKQEGEAIASPSYIMLDVLDDLMHGYLDLPRFGLFGLGDVYLEYSVLIRGLNPVMIYGFRKGKGPYEFSVNPFNSTVFHALGRLSRLPLACKRQRTFF
jgi:hypothetical protein